MKLSLFILLFVSLFTYASDHVDGVPVLGKHKQVDLTDLYLFPTKDKKNSFSVILNTSPGSTPKSHFSPKVSYSITFKTGRSELSPLALVGEEGEKAQILCEFFETRWLWNHNVDDFTCTLQGNKIESAAFNGKVGKTEDFGKIKITMKSSLDSFFMGQEQFSNFVERKSFDSYGSKVVENLMSGVNVLSIELEIDLDLITSDLNNTKIAIVAQSYHNNKEDGQLDGKDRVGRPEITNLSLSRFNKNPPLKVSYNSEDPFSIDQQNYKKYQKRLIENITFYDDNFGDKEKSWSSDGLEKFTQVILSDFLIVDLNKPCSDKNNFFEIEKAYLKGVPNQACGGRHLTDDIMSVLFALYIDGLDANLDNFQSGLTGPYHGTQFKLNDSHPYLVDAQYAGVFSPKARLKRWVIDGLLENTEDQDKDHKED